MKSHYAIKTIILIIFSALPTLSFAASWNGWIYQKLYPTSNNLSAVKFVTPKKGWVAGVQGTILYTEDGGDTWEPQESGTEQDLVSIYFVNDRMGWVIGDRGIIIHTDNGGKTWVLQSEVNTFLKCIFFVNEKRGWVVGGEGSIWDGNLRETIFHTVDSGKKWERQNLGIYRSISSIFFIDSNIGWFLAGDEVFRTKDGGGKWEKSKLEVTLQATANSIRLEHIKEQFYEREQWKGNIFFADKKHGWILLGSWLIYHSEDGGKTWVNQLSTFQKFGLNYISFSDAQSGCASGSNILCTDDGGKTWTERLEIKLSEGNRGETLEGISFVNHASAWVAGARGQILNTTDGGKTWKIISGRDECGGEAFFIDKKTGWLHGHGNSSICRTYDGGRTREKQNVGINVWSIFFINSVTGWAVGTIEEEKEGKIFKVWGVIRQTTDGGKTWTTQFKELMGKDRFGTGLGGVFFMNSSIGWAVGEKGFILHTKDGGKNWVRQESGMSRTVLTGVKFIDAKVGWTIGTKVSGGWTGVILRTDDGGKNWRINWEKGDVWFSGIFIMDKNSVWVTGESESYDVGIGWVLHTNNGGKTWSEKALGEIGDSNPAFLDKKHGILATDTGWILVTNDGGRTWSEQRTPLRKYPWHFSEIFEKGKP